MLGNKKQKLIITVALILVVTGILLFSQKQSASKKLQNNKESYVNSQDLSKGVLAINTDKNIYKLGDQVYVQMSSIDNKGDTLCDSKLKLDITNQDTNEKTTFTTEDAVQLIQKSETCSADNNVTNDPDYKLFYKPAKSGKYTLDLSDLNTGQHTTSQFVVQDQLTNIQINRWSASRINPFKSDRYPMVISITANTDFKGTYEEILPSTFVIAWQGAAEKVQNQTSLNLKWTVDLKMGQTIELKYDYTAPQKSPEFYTINGSIGQQKNAPAETSNWQIASDGVAAGDGILMYGVSANTTPQFRKYTNSTNLMGNAGNVVSGTQPNIVVLKASPIRNEMVGGYIDTNSRLHIVCYDGTTWSEEWSVGVGSSTIRRFNIAYESNSGDVLVLYSRNTATPNELGYRTKLNSAGGCSSSNWSTESTFDPVRTSGTVNWVELAADPRSSSDLIGAAWTDSNNDLSAAIWNGSSFTNEPSSARETNLDVIATTGDVDDIELSAEATTGEFMLVWGDCTTSCSTNTAHAEYSTCTGGTSGCTWLAPTLIPTVSDRAQWIELGNDPETDDLVVSMLGEAGTSDDMTAAYWSGSAWTGFANVDSSAENMTTGAGQNATAAGFVTNGGSTYCVIQYDDASGTGISWKYQTSPCTGAWTSPSDQTVTPSLNDIRDQYRSVQNPNDHSELMVTIMDSTGAIYVKRLKLGSDGTTFTWSEPDGQSSMGTANSHPQKDFDFAYNIVSAVTISGALRQTDESTAYNCSSDTVTVHISVNGGSNKNYDCTSSGGTFTFDVVSPTTGQPVAVFADSGEPTYKGTTVTRATTTGSDISNLDIYQNELVVTHEDAGPITNANLSTADNADAGIRYSVSSSNLTVDSGIELHIKTSKTFTPGGNVTTQGTGIIHLDDSSALTGATTQTHTSAGSITIDAGATYTAPTSGSVTAASLINTGTFTAGGTTLTLNGTSGTLFTNTNTFTPGSSTVTFTPDASVTLFSGTAPLNNLSMTPTITAGRTYTVGTAVSLSGNLTVNPTAATSLALTVNAGGNITGGATTTTTLTGTTSGTSLLDLRPSTTDYDLTTGLLNIASAGTLDCTSAASTITLNGTSGTLFTRSGTFTQGSSTVTVTSASGSPTLNSGTITFYNLTINPSTLSIATSTDAITVSNTLNVTTNNTLSLVSGQNLSHTGTTLTLNGTISGAGRLIYSSTTAFPTTGTISSILRMDNTSADLALGQRTYGGDVEIYSNSSGATHTTTLGTAISQTLTFSANLYLIADNTQNIVLSGSTYNPALAITGNVDYTGTGGGTESITTGTGIWTVSGNIDLTAGTLTATAGNTIKMNGTSKSLTSNAQTLQNFEQTGGTVSTVGATDINGTFTLTSGTFTQSATTNINIAGNFTLSSGTTFTKSTSGLLIFDGDLTYTDSTAGLQDVGDVQIGLSPDTTNLASDMKANSLTVTSADFFYTNGYDLDIGTGGISISGTFDAVDDVETDETTINCAGNFAINSGASFVQDQSNLIMDAASGTKTLITDGSFSLYNLEIAVAGGATVEVQDPLDADNNLTITSGTLDVVTGENNQINVGGNWSNAGTFTERSGKVVLDGTTSTTLVSGCTDVTACTTQNFYDLELNKTSGTDANDNVTLTTNGIRVTNTITITDGELVQGTLNVQAEGTTGTAVNVTSNGYWNNTSTGDINLGGTFNNDGIATFQANGATCGDAKDITIASTAAAQRSWTGTGTFNINDVSVSYQAGTASINAFSSTDGGNNGTNWHIYTDCTLPPTGDSLMNLDGNLLFNNLLFSN